MPVPGNLQRSAQGRIAVVTTAPDADSTIVAVRCEEYAEAEYLYWRSGKLTAIEVNDEAQTD
jgi:hypothetical protein